MKEYLNKYAYFDNKPLLKSFIGSMVGGIAISVMMNPFDFVLTRLYNQRKLIILISWETIISFSVTATDDKGNGKIYSSYVDCVTKIYKTEGLSAFYKGIGPMYLRLGPHSVLCLVFWDEFQKLYDNYSNK